MVKPATIYKRILAPEADISGKDDKNPLHLDVVDRYLIDTKSSSVQLTGAFRLFCGQFVHELYRQLG